MERESPLKRLKPHTRAKHRILRHYLDAWYPILAKGFAKGFRQGTEILYVEGFAGPGFYTGGDEGSPIVALRAAYECADPMRARFLFVEEEKRSAALLQAEIDRFTTEEGLRDYIALEEVRQGDCTTVLTPFIEERIAKGWLGPAFFFLDQLGFTDVPMALVKRIVSQKSCEVFVFLEMNRLRATLSQEDGREEKITSAFGDDGWKRARELSGVACQVFLREEYDRCLKRHCGPAAHVLDFTMRDHKNEMVSCLFHVTGHPLGFDTMKTAMRKVDRNRSFADKSGHLDMLIDTSDTPEDVAYRLQRDKSGVDLTFPEVQEFVRGTDEVNPRPPLVILEERGDLVVSGVTAEARRLPKTYPQRLWGTMRLRVKPKAPTP